MLRCTEYDYSPSINRSCDRDKKKIVGSAAVGFKLSTSNSQ